MHTIGRRMEEATGLNRWQISRLMDEPEERRNDTRKKRQERLDDFQRTAVRNKVHKMYRRNEIVTLNNLRVNVRPEVDVSLSTLWRTLRQLGFRYIKKGDGNRVVMEWTDIISQRHQYLREVRRARERGEHIIYLDETWVNVNHACVGEWSENEPSMLRKLVGDGCGECGRSIPSGKGKRIIVLDAGCRDVELLPSVADVFVAKSDCGDYHSEMNHKHFLNWWSNTLLPALPGPSTIVLDQAPYHSVVTDESRAPTSKATVLTLRTWLRDRGIAITDDLLKAELLEMVRRNKPRPRYIVDDLAAAAGHRVLRLPPRHCELNPIELIWAQIKGYVARNNTTFKLTDTLALFHQGKALITSDVWNKCEDHVIRKIENVLWAVDGVRNDDIDPVIFSIDEVEDNEDETYDDFDDDDYRADPVIPDRAPLTDITNVLRTDNRQTVEPTAGCSAVETDSTVPCRMCGRAGDPPDDIVRKRERRKKGRNKACMTFEWILCDACDNWSHVDCIPRCEPSSDIFYCPPCKSILRTSYK